MAQNKILYCAKLGKNMHRSAHFKLNKQTFKSNIMLKFVTKAMDIKLRGEANFTTTLEDPIELLKCIEQFMKKSANAEYDLFTTTLEDPIELLKCIEQFMKKSANAECDFSDFLGSESKVLCHEARNKQKLDAFQGTILETG
ncbi:unnamed protein product [Cylindrotheca closterium]|uniref:Uncharacterized protein n=1 Tax=Cylindrotheca closterium TaxID=2856 RepID=A0AAD2JP38_9STRA|nr:unnamed protein product [Cylindrotheca closterium]